jgi:Na+-translocating ferredoxin:NAD+ oxidoreductase RnfA subunit
MSELIYHVASVIFGFALAKVIFAGLRWRMESDLPELDYSREDAILRDEEGN